MIARRILPLRSCIAIAVFAVATAADAQPVKTPNVEAELVSERSALVPGETGTLALRLEIRDRWHTYWRNPGDSGLATTLDWTLPAGMSAGAIQWPPPKALPVGPLVNYGYEGEVFHLVDVTVPPNLPLGQPVTVKARADWLVCEDVCIPEGADLTLELPVAKQAQPSRWSTAIGATREALPKPLAGWQSRAIGEGQTIRLVLTPTAGATDPGTLRFFPFTEGAVEPSGKQTLARDGERLVLTLPVAHQLTAKLDRVAGVLAASNGFGGAKAATIDVAMSGNVIAGPKPLDVPPPKLDVSGGAATSTLSLAAALLFALGGGLLLNLMPCVFPVLSLKVMGFVEHHDAKRTMHREAVAYSVGVVLSFVLLALLLVGLRAAGEQLGWGFQLQSPAVVAGLALLFFLLALNLSGVFEFGMFVPRRAASWTAKNRTLDAFASGVLAVIVASPCTAPFMGAALGYAISQSIPVTLVVFAALGIGMAIPYVLLAWFPGWRQRLPKPGVWMVRIKQFLAFPLYATVAWLAWVLGAQLDNDAVLRLAVALVFVGVATWAWRVFRTGGTRFWAGVAIAGVAGVVVLVAPLFGGSVGSSPARAAKAQAVDEWRAFSPATVEALTAKGQPVFVDFTAAWCVTCQVNKRLVLNDAAVKSAFAKRNVALVRADWTRRDPQITQALAALGRHGVPVYVLYRPGKSPLLLPEVLQPGLVHDALATL